MVRVLIATLFLWAVIVSGTEIEPGDPEDIGPDAPQVTPPPEVPEEIQAVSIDTRIRQMLEHFKQDDPRGLPGVQIPDPLPIADFEGVFSGTKLKFTEAQLYNLSQFRIDYIRTDLKDLKVWIRLSFDSLEVLGRYRMSSWLSTSSGDFNVTVEGVYAIGFAGLVVDQEGVMQASNITLDLAFKDINLKFENLGFFGNLFQGIINSVGTFIFDSIKPNILNQLNDKIQSTVNTQMRSLNTYLPDSIPPLDVAMALVRNQLQENNLDPFQLPEIQTTLQSGVKVKLFNGTIKGLSTIHRNGDVTLGYENGSLIVGAHAATQRMSGVFDWQLDFKLFSPRGKVSLDIEYLDVKIGMQQPANVQKKPRLEVMKVRLGNIQARSSGTGSLDYLIEFAVNFVLNGFRGVILKAVEKPVTTIIQEQLDKLDVEALIDARLAGLAELNDDNNNI